MVFDCFHFSKHHFKFVYLNGIHSCLLKQGEYTFRIIGYNPAWGILPGQINNVGIVANIPQIPNVRPYPYYPQVPTVGAPSYRPPGVIPGSTNLGNLGRVTNTYPQLMPYPRVPNDGVPYPRVPITGGQYPRIPNTGEQYPRVPNTGLPYHRLPNTGGQYPRLPNTGVPYPRLSITGGQYPRVPNTGVPYPRVPITGGQYPRVPITGGQYPRLPITRVQYPRLPNNAVPYPNIGTPYSRLPITRVPSYRPPGVQVGNNVQLPNMWRPINPTNSWIGRTINPIWRSLYPQVPAGFNPVFYGQYLIGRTLPNGIQVNNGGMTYYPNTG